MRNVDRAAQVSWLCLAPTARAFLRTDCAPRAQPNLSHAALHVPALIADNERRRRDEQFATQARHVSLPHPLHDQSKAAPVSKPHFTPDNFVYDADARTCTCPAGKSLYRKGRANITKVTSANSFVTRNVIACRARGARNACGPPTRPTCATSHFSVAASSLTPYSRAKRIRCA